MKNGGDIRKRSRYSFEEIESGRFSQSVAVCIYDVPCHYSILKYLTFI